MPDIAHFLESALIAVSAHSITNLFLTLIIVIFIISLILLAINRAENFTSYTPGLLTSLGILGTFIGVVIGLLDFDSKNIDGSIELLLDGLKTAFITSLAGMAGAIIFKIIETTPILSGNSSYHNASDVEPKDILIALRRQEQRLILIKKAISNDADSNITDQIKLLRSEINNNDKIQPLMESLIGQIKLFRIETNNNNKHQQQSFAKFSEKLWLDLENLAETFSKSATEEVIHALQGVITDFNNNLTEQFGDNFKALDASVEKLVVWQAQYGEQIEHMISQYAQGVTAISDIENSVRNISQESLAIPAVMNQLNAIMVVNEHQIRELSRHLNAFKEVKEQAMQAVPEMQKHVEKTVEDIARSAKKASEGYQILLDSTENIQKSFTNSITDIQGQLESTVKKLVEKQVYEMNRSFDSLEKEVSKTVGLTGSAVNKQLEMIDASISQEVSRVMTEMGQALAQISGQFTSDYKELTQSMRKITKMARVPEYQ